MSFQPQGCDIYRNLLGLDLRLRKSNTRSQERG